MVAFCVSTMAATGAACRSSGQYMWVPLMMMIQIIIIHCPRPLAWRQNSIGAYDQSASPIFVAIIAESGKGKTVLFRTFRNASEEASKVTADVQLTIARSPSRQNSDDGGAIGASPLAKVTALTSGSIGGLSGHLGHGETVNVVTAEGSTVIKDLGVPRGVRHAFGVICDWWSGESTKTASNDASSKQSAAGYSTAEVSNPAVGFAIAIQEKDGVSHLIESTEAVNSGFSARFLFMPFESSEKSSIFDISSKAGAAATISAMYVEGAYDSPDEGAARACADPISPPN